MTLSHAQTSTNPKSYLFTGMMLESVFLSPHRHTHKIHYLWHHANSKPCMVMPATSCFLQPHNSALSLCHKCSHAPIWEDQNVHNGEGMALQWSINCQYRHSVTNLIVILIQFINANSQNKVLVILSVQTVKMWCVVFILYVVMVTASGLSVLATVGKHAPQLNLHFSYTFHYFRAI